MEDDQKIIAAQETFIKDMFGAEAAASANYGWSIDDGGVCTKVYNKGGCNFVTSEIVGDEVMHECD
tara:strand:+ start:15211 stop:15408 length:198 start_codon:yes stop_codon:yes gene_type:complete